MGKLNFKAHHLEGLRDGVYIKYEKTVELRKVFTTAKGITRG